MQQFTVPQFIDVEDKIIGPITARQFLIMLAGFMLIFICYKFLTFNLFLGTSILIFAFSGVLAFFKVNGMPFHFFILNFSQTAVRPGLRVWNHEHGKEQAVVNEIETHVAFSKEVPKKRSVSTSRLNELALIVDTQGSYQGERDEEEKNISIIRNNTI